MALKSKSIIMANVKLSLINPNFYDEAGDYLLANGFNLEINDGAFHFTKGPVGVYFKGDSADFLCLNEGEEGQRAYRLEPILQLTNICNIDTVFDWMLLFHVTRVVPLKKFIAEVRKTGVDPMRELMKHFQCTEDRNAVPTAY